MIIKHKDKFCKNCGKPLPKRNMVTRDGIRYLAHATHCQYCNPFDPVAAKNKFEQRSQSMANQYPELVQVLYECSCVSTKKLKHHFDYSRPYDVLLLCNKCHNAEHKRLRKLAKEQSKLNNENQPTKEGNP